MIIGRKEELNQLRELKDSKYSEFVAQPAGLLIAPHDLVIQ